MAKKEKQMPKRHYIFVDYISAKMTQQMLASQGKNYQIGRLVEGGFILFKNERDLGLTRIN